jgi:hypothetical protein
LFPQASNRNRFTKKPIQFVVTRGSPTNMSIVFPADCFCWHAQPDQFVAIRAELGKRSAETNINALPTTQLIT